MKYDVLKAEPWKHQVAAIAFAQSKSATMFNMGMGTGKTLCAIAEMARKRRILVVCPLSVIPVWREQIGQYANFPIEILIPAGTAEKKANQVWQFLQSEPHKNTTKIVVINYESAWRGKLGQTLSKKVSHWDLIITDESHRIKTPGSKVSRFFHSIGKIAKKRLCLTGTPMPHSPLDIYSQFKFLQPEVFGTSFTRFRARYAVMGGYAVNGRAVQVVGWQNEKDMSAKMSSITFSAKTSDVLDLPPTTFTKRHYDLSQKERSVYQNLKKEFIVAVGSNVITAANALTRLLRLQQVAHGVTKDDRGSEVRLGTSRRKCLHSVISDIGDEPIAVVGLYHSDLDDVHEVVASMNRDRKNRGKKSIRCVELSGRTKDIDGVWRKGDIAAIQIRAGGEGVDLTRARYLVLYGVGFSLGQYQQVLARVHRPGQTRPVTYIHIIGNDTMDGHIYTALESKEDVVASIMDKLERDIWT